MRQKPWFVSLTRDGANFWGHPPSSSTQWHFIRITLQVLLEVILFLIQMIMTETCMFRKGEVDFKHISWWCLWVLEVRIISSISSLDLSQKLGQWLHRPYLKEHLGFFFPHYFKRLKRIRISVPWELSYLHKMPHLKETLLRFFYNFLIAVL